MSPCHHPDEIGDDRIFHIFNVTWPYGSPPKVHVLPQKSDSAVTREAEHRPWACRPCLVWECMGRDGMDSFLPALQLTAQWQQPFACIFHEEIGTKDTFAQDVHLDPVSLISWHYREAQPKLWICSIWAGDFYVGMQDSLWYFWILTEGSAVTQTKPIFLRCWPSRPWKISWPMFVGSSAWKWSLCEPRLQDSTITNKELDSNHSALRHFPHHYKKWVCFVKISCYKTRNMRAAHWVGRAIMQGWGGRSSRCPLLQWSRVLCILCASLVIYKSFV